MGQKTRTGSEVVGLAVGRILGVGGGVKPGSRSSQEGLPKEWRHGSTKVARLSPAAGSIPSPRSSQTL